ncbi:Type IV inositol polyphosphate 5-phosphatase [Actinidia chinensis var. chinensis]|uniref:Type IV inositol polyphosphate 5-phosphatase n=1 Tax=Actinidia chinensis var. chinensis TaxID=1590841 RepID=A0A2R6PGH7_ACTCC|nr:Type IV inositol polyphosphate 5-phosphatase [Actinidia chinensis var. chinensis]
MWPMLVASKILGKRIGSNNFVADFPNNTEALLELSCLEQQSPRPKIIYNDDLETHNHKVFVSTWNVGGVAPSENLNLEGLLDTCNNPCDIYVLGFQEVVPLRASNVLGSENSRITMKWNSLIRKALNKKTDELEINEEGRLEAKQKQFPTKGGKPMESSVTVPEFRCIISKQMVGLFISVWVRSDLQPYVRSPNVSCVGCGIMSCLGNKGSVSVRFRLHETSFCFVCSHLASGGREGDERYRNSNAAEILSRTSFPRGPSLDLPRKILDHDRIILLGDLNYRISLPEPATRLLVDRGDWNALLRNDQLRIELMEGQVFEGWQEGTIKFAPTYKYYPNSNKYYGAVKGKRGEKKRAPAWCDRIIWFGEGLKQDLYTRGESRLSDHRPVKTIFTTEVGVSWKLKGLRSFFRSERFERITSQLDDLSSNIGRSSFQITKTIDHPIIL